MASPRPRVGRAHAELKRREGNNALRRVFAAALAPFRLGGVGLSDAAASPLSPGSHARATNAALVFAASLGVQLTVWVVLAVGPLAEPFEASELTLMGRKSMRPEHDLPAFYAGCFATVMLAWVWVRLLEARLAGRAGAAAESAARRGVWVHAGLAVASLVGFAALAMEVGRAVGAEGRLTSAALLALALPGAAAVLLLGIDHVLARRASS